MRDIISLNSNNYFLLKDVRNLGKSLGFICNPIHHHSNHDNEFYFTISNASLKKFIKMYKSLKQKFSTLNFGGKYEKITKLLDILNNSVKPKDLTKNILNNLDKPRATMEIVNISKQPYSTVLQKLQKMERENLISRKKEHLKKQHIWFRNNFHSDQTVI